MWEDADLQASTASHSCSCLINAITGPKPARHLRMPGFVRRCVDTVLLARSAPLLCITEKCPVCVMAFALHNNAKEKA